MAGDIKIKSEHTFPGPFHPNTKIRAAGKLKRWPCFWILESEWAFR
jgi:hypothetical protein